MRACSVAEIFFEHCRPKRKFHPRVEHCRMDCHLIPDFKKISPLPQRPFLGFTPPPEHSGINLSTAMIMVFFKFLFVLQSILHLQSQLTVIEIAFHLHMKQIRWLHDATLLLLDKMIYCIDRCKEELHDQTMVGKKADSAVFGASIARAVRALALERTTFWLHYQKEKRQA